MVEDGVYYEFYSNYALLFRWWVVTYAIIFVFPILYFGRRLITQKPLRVRLGIGVSTVLVFAALPFALVAESYFAHQEFMQLCRTEAALKAYQPIPEYTPGFAVDLGDDASLSDLRKCGGDCQRALLTYGYEFYEQISVKTPKAPDELRYIFRRSDDGGYEYIPYSSEPVLRVYRFYVTPAAEDGCQLSRGHHPGHRASWTRPTPTQLYCIEYEVSEIPSATQLFVVSIHPEDGCCIRWSQSRTTDLLMEMTLAEARSYTFGSAVYLQPFSRLIYGRMNATFLRCTTHVSNQFGSSILPWLVGFPKDRSL